MKCTRGSGGGGGLDTLREERITLGVASRKLSNERKGGKWGGPERLGANCKEGIRY